MNIEKDTFIAARWSLVLTFLVVLLAALPGGALAQDFYGEGNVLIAVDMGSFRVNEEAGYPEGTMGTLVWGGGCPHRHQHPPGF